MPVKFLGISDRGEWQYAKFVLALLIIAGLSTKWAIAGLERYPELAGNHHLLSILAMTILSLTVGFLFLAGAFGIWAIRSTQAVEGRRRYIQLIDDMDYLSDGIVLVDPEGRIHAMNAAARALTATVHRDYLDLAQAYPCLTADDVDRLVTSSRIREVERVARDGHSLFSLRFRCQPASGFRIILVSDVTAAKTRQMRDSQTGHLHLIGRIARTVSEDFNDILCTISAHAALCGRPSTTLDEARAAAQAITEQAIRGSKLARQIIQLGDSEEQEGPVTELKHHALNAIELLKVVLPPMWSFQVESRGECLPIPLAGNQVEQVFLNLGLHAAEELDHPGQVSILIEPGSWSRQGPRDVVIRIHALPAGMEGSAAETGHLVACEDGSVIESIVRSVIESAQGELEIFSTHQGRHRYVLRIPGLQAMEELATARTGTGLTDDLCRQVAGWHVLLARPNQHGQRDLEGQMRGLGMSVEFASDLVVVLGLLEGPTPFQTAIIDRRLLGDTADALLRAVVKLRPDLGLVVLTDSPDESWRNPRDDIAHLPYHAPPEAVLTAMIRSRELVAARSDSAD